MADVLDKEAREYWVWPITAKDRNLLPITLTSASITFTTGVGTITKTAPVVDGRFEILVSGPAAPTNPDAVVLPLGRTKYKITYVDVVERLISNEGTIVVV